MVALTAVLAAGLFAALSLGVLRRLRAQADEVAALAEQVRELSTRLGAAEQDASTALAQADIAESVLLNKGVADEEDLEAARARTAGGGAESGRARDEELH